MQLTTDTPLRKVTKPQAAAALEKNKGLSTVGDLLELVPRKYLPPTEPTDLSQLAEGEEVVVVARVARCHERPMRARRGSLFTAVVTDGQVEADLTFFRAHPHRKVLLPGRTGVFAGSAGRYQGRWQLTHPEYEIIDETVADERAAFHHDHQIPVYSATGPVTSFKTWNLVRLVLESIDTIPDPLPEAIRRRRGLPTRAAALDLVHRPRLEERPRDGLRRLRYDEAFVLQLILAQRRRASLSQPATPLPLRAQGLLRDFDERLPFPLTPGQLEVGRVLAQDLAHDRPMHRLLQGDVGSGKTVVALRAMLQAVDAGAQAALLAPTEVLAAQHLRTIGSLLGELAEAGMLGSSERATRLALLSGSQSAAARAAALREVETGEAGIVVGTHALLQGTVQFHDLALVVVDEQHRFGVHQRDALRAKGTRPPHLLVMTATPIPRTVAMTVFGDMETVTLGESPRGRLPVATHVVDEDKPGWTERVWQRVAEEIAAGRQVYVVCPRIGEPSDGTVLSPETTDEEAPAEDDAGETGGDAGDLPAVYAAADTLRSLPALADARMGILHGRLPAEQKDRIMRRFADGDLDVLVTTTVIEVGVDVPNATTMVVLGADRFGLSQLHQLRGRVGRGGAPGVCLLLTRAPSGPARERLDVLAGTTDGFELARRDVELRREGDVLGAKQSGRTSSVRFLRIGNAADETLIGQAREDAFELVEADPDLAEHPRLRARVAARLDEDQAAYLQRA